MWELPAFQQPMTFGLYPNAYGAGSAIQQIVCEITFAEAHCPIQNFGILKMEVVASSHKREQRARGRKKENRE